MQRSFTDPINDSSPKGLEVSIAKEEFGRDMIELDFRAIAIAAVITESDD